MKELEQDFAGTADDLDEIVARLESALADIDRLQLIVIGAKLSQVIEDVRSLAKR